MRIVLIIIELLAAVWGANIAYLSANAQDHASAILPIFMNDEQYSLFLPIMTGSAIQQDYDYIVIEKRLWDVYENGGSLSGPTIICGEKRQLVVNVVDGSGNPINGVAVQEQYGARDILVTGAQGKGDGVVEFILGRGQDVKVIRNADGRNVLSEVATGMTTDPANIPFDQLIAGRYCTDYKSCTKFVDAPGCWGHYSWTVTFQQRR